MCVELCLTKGFCARALTGRLGINSTGNIFYSTNTHRMYYGDAFLCVRNGCLELVESHNIEAVYLYNKYLANNPTENIVQLIRDQLDNVEITEAFIAYRIGRLRAKHLDTKWWAERISNRFQVNGDDWQLILSMPKLTNEDIVQQIKTFKEQSRLSRIAVLAQEMAQLVSESYDYSGCEQIFQPYNPKYT